MKKVAKKPLYVSYNQLPQYGLGSWLQENAGTIGCVVGAGLGTLIAPGIGTSIGASIGGAIGGGIQKSDANKDADALLAQQNKDAQASQQAAQQAQARQAYAAQFNSMNPHVQYSNQFACGGKMSNGGIIYTQMANGGILTQAPVGKFSTTKKSGKGFVKSDGGLLNSTTGIDGVTVYNTGGTHQQNPNGGIPVGKYGTVEQDEVRVGKYIFSNRF